MASTSSQRLTLLSIALLLLLGSSQLAPGALARNTQSQFFSFETTLEGWERDATDLELGAGVIDWSIERSQSYAACPRI